MTQKPQATIAELLLRAAQSGLARIDAQMLLLHVLGQPQGGRAWLLAHDTDPVTADTQAQFAGLCARRVAGEPIAYLTGVKEFWGLPLRVDARVLDPRPDTETLVAWALEVMANMRNPVIADLGTGSGAIALALQSERPDARVLAVDASADAIAVARANAAALQLPVEFAQSNWLEGVAQGPFDLIVSNPPYIPAADPHLAALTHEPLCALASGADGLDDIRRIITQAQHRLKPGGWLLLEHGYDQSDAVQTLLRAAQWHAVQSQNDLAGLARCTGAQRPD